MGNKTMENKWLPCSESFPDTFGDYSVIDLIWNDGSESDHCWRISEESKSHQMERFLDNNCLFHPILWRYSDRWIRKMKNNYE